MKILLSTKLEPTLFNSYINILRVLSYAGHECFQWPNDKSVFEIFHEVRPDIYIGPTPTEKEEKVIKEYNCTYTFPTKFQSADIFNYRPVKVSDIDMNYFACDFMSIIIHSQDEINRISKYLNQNLSFKLFSPFKYSESEYCQNIPEHLYATALSCTKTPIATNFINMYNFTVINPNTLYPLFSETEPYSKDRILSNHTCFHATKDFIEFNKLDNLLDNDWIGLYDKFRNEVGLE